MVKIDYAENKLKKEKKKRKIGKCPFNQSTIIK